MKRISFHSDLMPKVISGEKTQTRRLIRINEDGKKTPIFHTELRMEFLKTNPKYEAGETVAILEPYKDIYKDQILPGIPVKNKYKTIIRPEDARYGIKILNAEEERLFDISEENALTEGIECKYLADIGEHAYANYSSIHTYRKESSWYNESERHAKYGRYFSAAELSFITLFEKFLDAKQRGRNWWVWAYEFELVKLKPELCHAQMSVL